MQKIISFQGPSGSGKTSSIEKIIEKIVAKGISVGVIKNVHSEKYEMDIKGKDTWRFNKAGASIVSGLGNDKTGIYINKRVEIQDLLKEYNQEIVILEGNFQVNCPLILTAFTQKDIEERKNNNLIAITGKISNTLSEYETLPVINSLKNTDEIVNLILNL